MIKVNLTMPCGVPLQGEWRRVGVVAGMGVVSLVVILTLSERPER
jgi:hypothetical protein